MTLRNNFLALLAAVAVGAATASHAQTPVVSLDYGIEASTDTMLMPSSDLGSVVLTCASCASRSYQLTGETIYLVGNRPVTFAELGANLKSGGVRSVMLFIKPGSPVVARIAVPAARK